MTDLPPALRAAIEGVLLHRSHLRKLLPDAVIPADDLAAAIAVAGNGPATAAWAVWQAIEALDRAWMAMQPPPPAPGHSVDRPT